MNLSFTKHTLANGLDVLLHEDHDCPIVAINVWYHVGSKNERPGHTGFAHLFEHLMFEGSAHHDHGYFQPLQGAGAALNGSTNADRTNYWEVVPVNALELALWMESDRMGYLLPALTEAKFANQRAVVLNERRQNYENRPYGLSAMAIPAALYPARSSLSLDHDRRGRGSERRQARRGPRIFHAATTIPPTHRWRSRATSIPRERSTWSAHTSKRFLPATPSNRFAPTRRSIGTSGSISRTASSCRVFIWRGSRRPCSRRGTPTWISPATFSPTARPRACIGGSSSRSALPPMSPPRRIRARSVDTSRWRPPQLRGTPSPTSSAWSSTRSRRFAREGPTDDEVERGRVQAEAQFVFRLQTVGGFGGKSDQLNAYNVLVGDPDYFLRDQQRYLVATGASLRHCTARYLDAVSHVTLSIVPPGRSDLAIPDSRAAVVS